VPRRSAAAAFRGGQQGRIRLRVVTAGLDRHRHREYVVPGRRQEADDVRGHDGQGAQADRDRSEAAKLYMQFVSDETTAGALETMYGICAEPEGDIEIWDKAVL